MVYSLTQECGAINTLPGSESLTVDRQSEIIQVCPDVSPCAHARTHTLAHAGIQKRERSVGKVGSEGGKEMQAHERSVHC